MPRPLVSLLDAFVPTWCISCKAVGSLYCSKCRSTLKLDEHQVTRAEFTGWSAFVLDPEVANLILAFKDRGRTALAPYLARKLLGPLSNFNRAGVQLAALPTSRSALARRGFDAGAFLVRALARESGLPVSNSLLSLERQPADQRSLAAGQRAANLFESMSAKPGGGRILIVDDIVTTGASLLEARRALVAAGFEVAGFVTVAETLLQKSTNLPKEAAPIL